VLVVESKQATTKGNVPLHQDLAWSELDRISNEDYSMADSLLTPRDHPERGERKEGGRETDLPQTTPRQTTCLPGEWREEERGLSTMIVSVGKMTFHIRRKVVGLCVDEKEHTRHSSGGQGER
jgi:hypothetical protein